MKKNNSNTIFLLTPLFGIIIYILIYILATYLYPGGSDYDKTAPGFSWLHNYWCELLKEKAPNGALNAARPVAIFGMFVLAAGIIMFWYLFSIVFNNKNSWLIRYTGILSMVIALFLFVGPHDLIMIVSGLLGLLALAICLVILYRQKKYWLIIIGWFCIVLCAVNNYIYYTGYGFSWLALIQKFTFLFFFYWFIAVNFYMYRVKKELQ